jgi:hypothetical protein
MSRSKHTEAQIIAALKPVGAGRTAEDVAREQGVSKQRIPAGFVGASGPAAVSHVGMARAAMLSRAFNAVTGADSSLVSLSGEASLASTAIMGAEFATGFGEAKFIYDGITFFGATAGCALGLIP